jgi:hypothetical protein
MPNTKVVDEDGNPTVGPRILRLFEGFIMFDEFLLSQTNSLSLRDSYIEKSVEKQKEQYEREEARIITIPRVSSTEGVDRGAKSGNNANIQGGTSRQTSGYGVRTEATQDERGTAQEEAFGNRRGSKHFRSTSRGGLLSDDTRYALISIKRAT